MKMRKIKNMLKSINKFWIDEDGHTYKRENVSNKYLENIMHKCANNKWPSTFSCTKRRINKIFKEAYDRAVCRYDVILNLHAWTLFYQGYSNEHPSKIVDLSGNYYRLERN